VKISQVVWKIRKWMSGIIEPGPYAFTPFEIPKKRSVADLLDELDPIDVPMLSYLGITSGRRRSAWRPRKLDLSNWPAENPDKLVMDWRTSDVVPKEEVWLISEDGLVSKIMNMEEINDSTDK